MEVIERKYKTSTNCDGDHATWLIKSGLYYFLIDYNSCPFDTGKPETMAFAADKNGMVTNWGKELAVSYEKNPTKGIQDCVRQLRVKGLIYD